MTNETSILIRHNCIAVTLMLVLAACDNNKNKPSEKTVTTSTASVDASTSASAPAIKIINFKNDPNDPCSARSLCPNSIGVPLFNEKCRGLLKNNSGMKAYEQCLVENEVCADDGKSAWFHENYHIPDSILKECYLREKEANENDDESLTLYESDRVSAQALSEAYNANQLSADEKYKGKLIEVIGAASKVATDYNDRVHLSLKGGGPYSLNEVRCFPTEKTKKAKTLNIIQPNDIVVIRGRIADNNRGGFYVDIESCFVKSITR